MSARSILACTALVSFALPARSQTWRFVEEWRVGGDVAGAHAFNDVRDLDVFPDGRLLIVEAKTNQLHILSSNGAPVRSIGHVGSGPGEFQYLNGAAIASDGRIVTHDPHNNRFSVFTPMGDFVRTSPVPARGVSLRWSGYFDSSGRLVEPVSIRSTERRIGGTNNAPFVTVRGTVMAWDSSLTRTDTVPLVDCPGVSLTPDERFFVFETTSGALTRSIPFALQTSSTAGSDGYVWALLSRNEIVRRRRGTCVAVASVPLSWPRVEVPRDARRAAVDSVTRAATSVKVPVPDLSRIPREYPPFESLRVDAVGRLWIERRTGAVSIEYRVYAPDGRFLATVPKPAGVSNDLPFVMTRNRAFAFVLDEDGVPFLVAMRLATQ